MAWFKNGGQRQLEALERRVAGLEETETTLMRMTRDAIEQLEDLRTKHTKLRGRVYAAGLHKMAKDDDAEESPRSTANMTRDELKRELARSGRFMPGKPAVHTE